MRGKQLQQYLMILLATRVGYWSCHKLAILVSMDVLLWQSMLTLQ